MDVFRFIESDPNGTYLEEGTYSAVARAYANEIKRSAAGSPVADTVKAAVVSPVQGFLGRPADGIVFPPDLPQEQIEEIRHSEGGKRILREENGEIKIQDSPWIQINSRFEEINASFKDILGGELFDKISALSESRKEEPVYVLGWGAGDLTEIMDLHDRLKAKGRNNVFILAFGDTFYPASKPIPDNILFIVDTDTKLQERIKEFVGNGKIDIIYSYTSLWHLLPTHNEDSAKLKRFLGHLRELENLLAEDGFIVFDFVPEQHGWGGYIQQYSSQNGRVLTVKTYNAETGAALLIRSKVAASSPLQADTAAPWTDSHLKSLAQSVKASTKIDEGLDYIALAITRIRSAFLKVLTRDPEDKEVINIFKFMESDPDRRHLDEATYSQVAEAYANEIKRTGRINNASVVNLSHAGSPVAPDESASSIAEDKKGGIDMRSLPKYTKVERVATGSPLVKQGQSPPATEASAGRSGTGSVSDKEWQEIERMASSGIAPSCERIREYLLSLQDPNSQIDKVLACIAGILRQEEEKVCSTEAALREILVLLESGKPVNELRLALINIQVLAKEPQLIIQ